MNTTYDKERNDKPVLVKFVFNVIVFQVCFLPIIFPFSCYRPYPSDRISFLSAFCLTHCIFCSMSMKFRSIKWLPITYSVHVVSEGSLSVHFHRLFFRFYFFNLLFNLLYFIPQVASQPCSKAANESPYCTRKAAHIEVCTLAFVTN